MRAACELLGWMEMVYKNEGQLYKYQFKKLSKEISSQMA
jgi:hypothetical protein